MKTIEHFLRSICGTLNWNYSELKESCPELIQEATEATKSLIREAIKADRINVAKHALVEFTPFDEESWDGQKSITLKEIVEVYSDGEDEDWGFKQLQERDGFQIDIDENSILHAPEIELL